MAWKGSEAHLIDTTICADANANAASLNDVFRRKIEYYDNECIREWIKNASGAQNIKFSALVFNWRGDLAAPSHRLLKGLHMIGNIKLMEVSLMESNSNILRFFKQAAGRWG